MVSRPLYCSARYDSVKSFDEKSFNTIDAIFFFFHLKHIFTKARLELSNRYYEQEIVG